MNIFTPEYYHRFRCIAAACEDSCCKEWAVDVDPEAAARYRALPGPLGDRLRQVLTDTPDGPVMTIENGRCPMWRQDGLCRIQAELGHDALCRVCREFPRLRHDYGDFVELGLELSCPEAARLILSDRGLWQISQAPGGDAPDYDTEAMAILRRSRQWLLDFLGDTALPVPEALAVTLLYGYEIQAQLDGAEASPFDPDAALSDCKKFARPADSGAFLNFFRGLEILTPQWQARLEAGPAPGPWGEELRALARYMIARYYLQAVSDYDLVSRVKFAVTACVLVNTLGGDPVATAQQFSKEIENDPDNVDAILDAAYTHPDFADTALLGLLLPT